MMLRPWTLFGPCAALLLVACGSDGSSTPRVILEPDTSLRIAGPRTAGGEGDGLAADLLLAQGIPVPIPGIPKIAISNPDLSDSLGFLARAHLEASALATGAGASGVASDRIRRLAAETGAPPDRNQNGSNLDETWSAELALLRQAAGHTAELTGEQPLLFAWRESTADFAAPAAGATRTDYARGRTAAWPERGVDLEQVAHGMRARVLLAISLLWQNRGSQHGATAADGLAGLLALQQAIAVEETLVGSLFFDGKALGRLKDPGSYDPKNGVRWLPAGFGVVEETAQPGWPAAYTLRDRASSLSAVAALLESETLLAWLGSDSDPYPHLRDLVHGLPFGQANEPRKPRPTRPMLANFGTEITYDVDIKPILTFNCTGCHFGVQGSGGFDCSTYDGVLKGGNHRLTHPTVVKGSSAASLIWRVLKGPVPEINVPQMPQGGQLTPGEISLFADWIDGGALRSPSTPIPPPAIGLDLARVLLKNLRALHFDSATGGLYDRHDGDAPADFFASGSTGAALSALALVVEALPAEADAQTMLSAAADFAYKRLTTGTGWVPEGVDKNLAPSRGLVTTSAYADLTAGLYAAGRALRRPDLTLRGRVLAKTLFQWFWDPEASLFITDQATMTKRYTPLTTTALLGMLREAAQDGFNGGAPAMHEQFLLTLRKKLAFSEWDGRGEILGDGVADTDRNGIPEPALAGGANGRAPVFAGEILQGPPPGTVGTFNEPITWSKHIAPLFRQTCVGCHLDGVARGEYRLDTPTLARTPGESKGRFPLIVPGEPENSLLYRKLVDRRPPVGEQMPLQKPPLDGHGKELVRLWILQGAGSR